MIDLHVSDSAPDDVATMPIVMTHGMADTSAHWDGLASRLQDAGHRTITWDLPGHGGSARLDDPDCYGPALALESLSRVVNGSGSEYVVLCGHSLGGYVSCWYSILHPGRVGALILIGAGPGFRSPDARETWNDSVRASAEKLGDDAALMGLHVDSFVIDHVTDISCPTLVLVGERDQRFGGSADYFERKLEDVERHTIAGAGHMASVKAPDAVADLTVDFLARRV